MQILDRITTDPSAYADRIDHSLGSMRIFELSQLGGIQPCRVQETAIDLALDSVENNPEYSEVLAVLPSLNFPEQSQVYMRMTYCDLRRRPS